MLKYCFIFLITCLLFFSCDLDNNDSGQDDSLNDVDQNSLVGFFVDYSTGDDSNAGTTKEAPWKFCPGMEGWTGTAELTAGDTVYFKNDSVWLVKKSEYDGCFLSIKGGVTYDGMSWGLYKSKAIFRAQETLGWAIVAFNDDHDTLPTIVKGLEIDGNNIRNSGIMINYFGERDLTGAVKRIEECVVHDYAPIEVWAYAIDITSGGYDNPARAYTVKNVEVINCTVYNSQWSGIGTYSANDHPDHRIENVLIKGCTVYNVKIPFGFKNHISNAIVENNYIYNNNGAGIGINVNDTSGFRGSESIIIRNNIIANNDVSGIWFFGPGDRNADIYGNIIYGNEYSGIQIDLYNGENLTGGTLNIKVYNNTLIGNGTDDWSQEFRVRRETGTIALLELINNIFYSTYNNQNHRLIIDMETSITKHQNNLLYQPIGGVYVISGAVNYTSDNVSGWEPSAIVGNPLCNNIDDPPTGFITSNEMLVPNTDGFALQANSPAVDTGSDLGIDFMSSIIGINRPNGFGWDIGAYER